MEITLFTGLPGMADLLKQATRMRGEAKKIDEELRRLVVEASAGGGLVKVRMSGKQELLECKIDPQMFADHDAEFLEDLIVSAINQALEKAGTTAAEKFGQLTGGIKIPGLTDALREISAGDDVASS